MIRQYKKAVLSQRWQREKNWLG